MTKELKAFRFDDMEVKQDGDLMTISGYGSTFGGEPDAYGDVIAPGAFAETLRQRMPKMLYQHRSDKLCGVWTEAREDGKGLFLKGAFLNTTLGRDCYEEAKAGALDSMSIGFRTLAEELDKGSKVRLIKAVKLYEVSLVTFPANENARVIAVKGEPPQTIREFEELLRDAGGFSRERAKAIAAHGFKAEDAQRDAEDLTPTLTALTKLTTTLKGFYDQ